MKPAFGRFPRPALIDRGSGQAILLLHGTAPGVSASANFGPLLPLLPEYRVIAPDLLGLGDSPKPTGLPYGPDLWAEQGWDVLDSLGVDDVVLVGNSMGARIAATMAVTHPTRVRGMVMLSARLHPSRSTAQDLIRAYEPDRDAMAKLIRECFTDDPALITDALVDARYAASAAPGAHETLRTLFTSMLAIGPGPSPTQLRQLGFPITLMAGREDRIVPFTDSLELADHLDADVHVFSGTGHWFPVERTATLAALLHEFVQCLEPSPAVHEHSPSTSTPP